MKTSAYEIAVLYHPDLEIDLEKAEAKFKKIVESNNGEIKNAPTIIALQWLIINRQRLINNAL